MSGLACVRACVRRVSNSLGKGYLTVTAGYSTDDSEHNRLKAFNNENVSMLTLPLFTADGSSWMRALRDLLQKVGSDA